MSQDLSKTFDGVAALYDAVRPTYPTALIDRVSAAMPAGGRILEIGCGTGQATAAFARKGFGIVALEPGLNLAALAAKNLSAFPNVTIEPLKFEDYHLTEASFDVVLSATAFHWVDPHVRYRKTARALKPGGHLAVFWNMPADQDDKLSRDIQAEYDRWKYMGSEPPRNEPLKVRIGRWQDEIAHSKFFAAPKVIQFPWNQQYDTQTYLQLLDTYSDHIVLAPERRRGLYDGIAGVLERNGGGIEKKYVAALFLSRRS